jgi:predicted ATP-binding protein involved in virulence
MFREDTALTQVGDWLVDLEFRLLKEPSDEFARRTLGVAVKALEKVLLGVHFKTITKDGEVIFEENGISVPLDRLSDGYRSVTSWVGDLVRRLVEAYPTDPLNAHGVVLIDELDIHLHPKWQRSIVEHVRALFPNLQFIVSSHSPFVAQDMTDDDKIIVLKREGNQVVAVQDSHSVTGWRVDQILTSYMFDLESTRDIEIAVTEQEYQRLLDMQASGSLSPGQKRKLNDLRDWLQEHRSGPGETPVADSVYYAAKTVLGILDEYLSR